LPAQIGYILSCRSSFPPFFLFRQNESERINDALLSASHNIIYRKNVTLTLNVPEVYDLNRDPKELHGISSCMGTTGTEHLSWVVPAVIKRVIAFKMTLKEEPPVPFPAPEPYKPTK
jgi:hypothetical protein